MPQSLFLAARGIVLIEMQRQRGNGFGENPHAGVPCRHLHGAALIDGFACHGIAKQEGIAAAVQRIAGLVPRFEQLSDHAHEISSILWIQVDFVKKFGYNFAIDKEVSKMPTIKSSADLRNSYNDISNFCHAYAEPVFITKNGKGDLAVMSIEAYEQLMGRFELYGKLQEGMNDIEQGNTRPFAEAMANMRRRRRR